MKYVSVCYYLFFVYFSVCVRLHNPAVVWFNDRILQYIIVLDVPVLKQRKAARDQLLFVLYVDFLLVFYLFRRTILMFELAINVQMLVDA